MQDMARSAARHGAFTVGAEAAAYSARAAHAAAPTRCRVCAHAACGGVARTVSASFAPAPMRISVLAAVEDRG